MLLSTAAFAVRLVWPNRCAGCRVHLRPGPPFCGPCELDVHPLEGACLGCALPSPISGLGEPTNGRCGPCRSGRFPFATARAGVVYGGSIAAALLRLKHGGRLELVRPLARLLLEPLAEAVACERPDLMVPVPLHRTRLRQRGFNQSLELAREARRLLSARDSRTLDLPVAPGLLTRTRATNPLGRASPAERQAALVGAFLARPHPRLAGRRVLLVDDVITSAATASGCARALLEAGAGSVHLLALARAL